MQESDTDRWQLLVAVVLLLLIAAGIYVARHEGPLIVAPGSRQGAARAKSKPQQEPRAAASAARSSHARTANTNDTARDAAVEGREDCRDRNADDPELLEKRTAPAVRLQAAVALVDSDRGAAMGAMRALEGSAVPDAYLAYLLLDAAKIDEARPALARARHDLPEPACLLSLRAPGDPKRSDVALALRALRFAIESTTYQAENLPLACSIFQTHQKDAVWAFGAVWGNAADRAGRVMKLYCIRQLLRRAAPNMERSVTQAHDKLYDALLRAHEVPNDERYFSIHVVVGNIIRDALLAPELVTLVDEQVTERELAEMATNDPALGGRIAAYRQVVAAQAPAIGKGICGVLLARDRAAEPKLCEHLARKSAIEALYFWLSATEGGSH